MGDPRACIVFHNPDIRVGFHIGKEPSLYRSFEIHQSSPLRSYQIYIANSRSYTPPKIDSTDIRMTRSLLERNNKYACVHGSLLYNMAGSTDYKKDPRYSTKLENTRRGITSELDVAAGFGAGVVVHTGCCKETEKGLKTVAETIEEVLTRITPDTKKLSKELQIPVEDLVSSRKIILENAAGERNKLGSNLDQISTILNFVRKDLQPQIKICIDTAHTFGAGEYNFGDADEVVRFYEEFDDKIGLEKLELFHFNDSNVEFGSCKDRHQNLGLGYQFGVEDSTSGLLKFVEYAEERRIPLIGEPPGPGILDLAFLGEYCDLGKVEFVC